MEGSAPRHDPGRRFFSLRPDAPDAPGGQCVLQLGRIVLLTLVGEPPAGTQCCHNDGDPSNNDLGNLRWDTPSANSADALRHGARPLVLTEAERSAIRSEYIRRNAPLGGTLKGPLTGSQSWLAAKYGVSHATISMVVRGRR